MGAPPPRCRCDAVPIGQCGSRYLDGGAWPIRRPGWGFAAFGTLRYHRCPSGTRPSRKGAPNSARGHRRSCSRRSGMSPPRPDSGGAVVPRHPAPAARYVRRRLRSDPTPHRGAPWPCRAYRIRLARRWSPTARVGPGCSRHCAGWSAVAVSSHGRPTATGANARLGADGYPASNSRPPTALVSSRLSGPPFTKTRRSYCSAKAAGSSTWASEAKRWRISSSEKKGAKPAT